MARPAAAAAPGWGFDKFDDGSTKALAQERELNRLGVITREHQEKLRKVQTALETALGLAYDKTLAPLQLRVEPNESLGILQLLHTPNKIMNKVLLAFSSLCSEVDVLMREAADIYYPTLVMYGEVVSNEAVGEGAAQVMMGKSLLFLQDLCNFVRRIYAVVLNMMQQLGALFTPSGRNAVGLDVRNVHWAPVFEKLADLLGVLITLDEIIHYNENLLQHWQLYRRMIGIVAGDPARFGVEENKLRMVTRMLQTIEGTVLDGQIFENCVEQKYDFENILNVTRSPPLAAEVLFNITEFMNYLDQRIGEANETDQRARYVGLCGLFVFYYRLFKPNLDKKFFKTLYSVHKKLPVIHLFGNVWWSSTDFFGKVVKQLVLALGKSEVPQTRAASLKKLVDTLPTTATEWYGAVCVWMVRLTSDLNSAVKSREVLNTRIALFLQGLLYASSISNLVKQTIDLHLMLNSPLSKKVVRPLTKLIELLKAIESMFDQNTTFLASSMTFMVAHLTSSLFAILQPIKDRVYAQRATSDRALDVMTALDLMIEMLDGPATRDRLVLFELALCNSQQMVWLVWLHPVPQPVYRPEELDEVRNLYRKLDALTTLQSRCNFMFWNRVLLPTYFAELYDNPADAQNIQYMMAAINDTFPLLERAVHNPVAIVREFEQEVERLLEENIVDRLAKDIETDLRLHIHSHLKLDDRNPFKVGLKDRSPFLRTQPLRFFGRTLAIKERVTHYLDQTFYNLTTVALHDWRTYAEMRNLAKEKYGIEMTEVHLPSGTLEQGVDALEIMRNIHVFVTRYNYNLNNQIFVERNSNNKHLNTINIRHIANSIRTHGTGVMNTTVNVTYQFLRKKFRIFSEFLYDDHIKSRLIKEIRYFKDNKEELNQKYPYDRAEKFNKSMRKLGTGQDGTTYLDQFRVLVTTIGNAMAYIRMVRSGGLHYCSNAINFLPELSDVLNLEDLVKRENLSTETSQAARSWCALGVVSNVDAAVDNLTKTFTSTTDYFQLLVDVFSKEFRDAKNIHLKNFYIIAPSLTLNFVEYLLASKDRIEKKRKDNAAFTDDGFAIGLAYILKLLDQNAAFDSLHWFTSVNEHYLDEARKMSQTKRKGDEQQSIVLTQKKLIVYRQEFDLLYFSLTGARIFFREEGENFAAATTEKEGDGSAPVAASADGTAAAPAGADGTAPA